MTGPGPSPAPAAVLHELRGERHDGLVLIGARPYAAIYAPLDRTLSGTDDYAEWAATLDTSPAEAPVGRYVYTDTADNGTRRMAYTDTVTAAAAYLDLTHRRTYPDTPDAPEEENR